MDLLNDRARNDMKNVEGPQNTNTTTTIIYALLQARAQTFEKMGVRI